MIECTKVKYFYYKDYLIAFNIRTLKVFKFKSGLKNILPKILPENFTDFQKEMFIKETERIENEEFKKYLKFLSFDDPYTNENIIRNTLAISFPTVHKCNLQCKYCYADAGENYNEVVKDMEEKVIEDIISYSLTNIAPDCDYLQISLVSGGEPLLNLDVMNHINQIVDKYHKGIKRKIFIASNMTLLNEKHIAFFDDIKPQIAISIDGPREVHNSMRVYKDGNGTYDDVVRNIQKLKDDCIITKTKGLMFMVVVTEKNLDLVNVLEHHLKLGTKSVQMKVSRGDESKYGISEENVSLFIDSYQKLIDYLLEQYINKNMEPLLALINGNDTMGKMIKSITLLEPNCYRCGAGKDRFSFTANGDIYPCDNFVGMKEFKLGNIYIDSTIHINEYWDYHTDSSDVCKKCWAKYLCSGDCYYNSYIRTGSMIVPESCMCEFFKKLSEMIIIFVAEMEDVDFEQYKKLKRILSIREKNNYIH
ncbi:MAG: radical SAM protein [Lachnospiraceae bacterium]|nr:radical SAM protein [Lachnospiraceae bacterium]